MKKSLLHWGVPQLILGISICIAILPVLVFQFFGTLDGPAHLYNSRILASLLRGDSLELLEFYQLNTVFIPNVLGHYLLAFFQWLVPIWIAEKIVILLFVLGTPYFLTKLLKRQSNFGWGIVLFSAITTPFFLTLGFYNFLLGVTFLFATLNYWDKWFAISMSKKQLLVLAILALATYLSHIFTFFLLIGLLFLHVFSHLILRTPFSLQQKVLAFIRITVIPAAMAIWFVTRPASTEVVKNYQWLPKAELLKQLLNFESFISFDFTFEVRYLRWLPIILVLLTLMVKYSLFVQMRNKQQLKHPTIFWGLTVLAAFFGLFILPDSDGAAGFFSIRISFFFFLFWMIWLGFHLQAVNKWLLGIALVTWGALQLPIYYNNYYKSSYLNQQAVQLYDLGEQLPKYSTLMVLGNSHNWLTAHFIDYMGIPNELIVMSNYEAANSYFPVKWNNPMLPSFYIHKTPLRELNHINGIINGYRRHLAVDLIVMYKTFVPDVPLQTLLDEQFELFQETDFLKIYQYQPENH